MSQFHFFDFTPREPFKKACNQWLSHLVERAPSDATCRASVTQVKNGYYFVVTIDSSVGSFKSETFLDQETSDRSRRDWQVKAIHDLDQKITLELERWLKTRQFGVKSSKSKVA